MSHQSNTLRIDLSEALREVGAHLDALMQCPAKPSASLHTITCRRRLGHPG